MLFFNPSAIAWDKGIWIVVSSQVLGEKPQKQNQLSLGVALFGDLYHSAGTEELPQRGLLKNKSPKGLRDGQMIESFRSMPVISCLWSG
jgi:hypothetical protein